MGRLRRLRRGGTLGPRWNGRALGGRRTSGADGANAAIAMISLRRSGVGAPGSVSFGICRVLRTGISSGRGNEFSEIGIRRAAETFPVVFPIF